MFESKYSNLLTVLLVIGIVIILGVILFVGVSVMSNDKLKNDAEDAVDQFQGQINGIIDDNDSIIIEGNEITNEITPIIGVENTVINNNNANANTNTNVNKYKGFPMVGTIEIPATDLKCPVLENSSKEAIEVAVGIYDGPGLNKIGNTTIAGHNYRNGTFFSDNEKIVNGDKIYITDTSGKKVAYVVYNTYITTPEDSKHLERDTQGKREITLTTCTDDAKSRIIILAKEQ